MYYIYIYMHSGINLPSKAPGSSPVLFYSAPHKSEKFQNPPLTFPLMQFAPLYFSFLQSFLKSNFSVNLHNIKIFQPYLNLIF